MTLSRAPSRLYFPATYPPYAAVPDPSSSPPPSSGMGPAQALAAALRELLASEGTAVLPGLGRLHRAHSAARIEVDDEGRRVLLPPRERIDFDADPFSGAAS